MGGEEVRILNNVSDLGIGWQGSKIWGGGQPPKFQNFGPPPTLKIAFFLIFTPPFSLIFPFFRTPPFLPHFFEIWGASPHSPMSTYGFRGRLSVPRRANLWNRAWPPRNLPNWFASTLSHWLEKIRWTTFRIIPVSLPNRQLLRKFEDQIPIWYSLKIWNFQNWIV